MKPKKSQFNVFERIESVKRLLAPISLNKDKVKIRGLVMKCARYHVGLIKKLNKNEASAYDLLLKNKLNPKTVYSWMLLEDVPPHIKEKLVQNKINFEDARRQFVQWKRFSGTRAANEIMEEMRNIIRRLKWRSQEESGRQY